MYSSSAKRKMSEDETIRTRANARTCFFMVFGTRAFTSTVISVLSLVVSITVLFVTQTGLSATFIFKNLFVASCVRLCHVSRKA